MFISDGKCSDFYVLYVFVCLFEAKMLVEACFSNEPIWCKICYEICYICLPVSQFSEKGVKRVFQKSKLTSVNNSCGLRSSHTAFCVL